MTRPTNIGGSALPKKGVKVQDSAAATINGPSLDRQGKLSCILLVQCGDATGTPTTQTVDGKLQDSADGSTGWADISGAAITALTANDGLAVKNVNLVSVKRYVRAVVTVAFTGGSTPKIPVSASIVLGGADVEPIT